MQVIGAQTIRESFLELCTMNELYFGDGPAIGPRHLDIFCILVNNGFRIFLIKLINQHKKMRVPRTKPWTKHYFKIYWIGQDKFCTERLSAITHEICKGHNRISDVPKKTTFIEKYCGNFSKAFVNSSIKTSSCFCCPWQVISIKANCIRHFATSKIQCFLHKHTVMANLTPVIEWS